MPGPKLPPVMSRKSSRPAFPAEPPVRRITRRQADLNRRYNHSYHGLVLNITKCLDREIPSHSQNPLLKDMPQPSHHRRMCSLTKMVLDRAVPSIPKENENPFYVVPHTDITERLKVKPPPHAMNKNEPVPWFGHASTSVTDPRLVEEEIAVPRVTPSISGQRSKSSLDMLNWSNEATAPSKSRCCKSSLENASSNQATSKSRCKSSLQNALSNEATGKSRCSSRLGNDSSNAPSKSRCRSSLEFSSSKSSE